MNVSDSMRLLSRYGLWTVGKRVSLSQALEMPRPIVLKADTDEHKLDKGLVFVGLASDIEIKKAYEKISKNYDVFAQPVVKGFEFVVGALENKSFGKIIMFGLGGTFTELFSDVTFRAVPLSKKDAIEMVDELKISKVFKGFRKVKPNKDAVVNVLMSISKLISENPINEIDVNPLMVNEEGAYVVDVRVMM